MLKKKWLWKAVKIVDFWRTVMAEGSPIFLPDAGSVRLDVSLKSRVQTLLIRLGKSQNWLAGEVGVSTGTMSKIVNGDWVPTSKTMVRMAKVLECDSAVLFGDSEYWKQWREKTLYGGAGE